VKVVSLLALAVLLSSLIAAALSPQVSSVPFLKLGLAEGKSQDEGAAGVMWVGPSVVSLGGNFATIGYRFNVTVWLNMTQDIYSYQIGLLYDRTQLKCIQAGFTDGRTSEYFTGHFSSENMVIDTSFLGNGSILAFESCEGSDFIPGQRVESLVWAEFEVVTAPSSNQSLTSKFDISIEYPQQTWVKNGNFDDIQIATLDAAYEILSSSDVSVSVSPAAVSMLVGQSQVFASSVSGGTAPYTFQWYVNGYAASDGTGPDWTFKPDTPGSYQVCLDVTDSSDAVMTSNIVPVDAASANVYNVTINAHCDTEGAEVNVPVAMDGLSTGFNTPHTFTNLSGTHTFTVPNSDLNGHAFQLWSGIDSTSTTIALCDGGTYTAYYGGDQRPGHAMWVEPSTVNLTGDSATIGYRFNVTVWLNMTQDIYSYSIGLLYNRTQLKCIRAGFTDGGTSEYFTGHYSTALMVIDTSYLHNGSILAYEGCIAQDQIKGPRVGSLVWAEFEVVTAPSSNQSLTSKFDISTQYSNDTWVDNIGLGKIQIETFDGAYEILSSSDVSVSVSPAAVSMLVGQSQVFASSVSGGTAPYTFQWYVNGYAASDGTGPDWTFKPDTPGSYEIYLEVADSLNSSNAVVMSSIVSVEATNPLSEPSSKPEPDQPFRPWFLLVFLLSCALGAGLIVFLSRHLVSSKALARVRGRQAAASMRRCSDDTRKDGIRECMCFWCSWQLRDKHRAQEYGN
jgi:hypothetical protein